MSSIPWAVVLMFGIFAAYLIYLAMTWQQIQADRTERRDIINRIMDLKADDD